MNALIKLAPLAALAAAICGCASNEKPIVLAPVGPRPARAESGKPTGALMVFTALVQTGHLTDMPYHRYHSDYDVVSADGKFSTRIHNDTGSVVEGPVTVNLPPGRYQVKARANGYGTVTVPVVIASGQVTTIHLDSDARGAETPSQTADAVRLPDGQIVGWQARHEP